MNYSRAACCALTALSIALSATASAQNEPSFADQVEARVLVLINDFRAEHGLRPVSREERLDDASAYFARYMASTGALEHRADGATPRQRVSKRGYDACSVSENIAYEYNSRGFTVERLARGFVDNWRDSPSHRANILDPLATETGLGVSRSAGGEYFAAQIFTQPRLKGRPCRR